MARQKQEEATNKSSDATNKLKGLLDKVEPWHVLVTLIAAIVGGIISAKAWISSTAREAVLDEKFLTTLASRVRPSCIFDSRGAVEADLGAMEYVNEILVIPAPQLYGYEIVIKAKKHLAYAPLVTGVDLDLLPQTSTRGRMHDWSIIVFPKSTMPGIYSDMGWDTNALHRFKLEILH